MPELPEVETICNAIKQSIDSPKIEEFKIINNKLRWKINRNIPSRVNGQIIKKIYRRAKYIIIEFDNGSLIIHLGMTGQFRKTHDAYLSHKHDHFLMKMSDDSIFVYNDVRKFGSIHWSSDIHRHFLIKNIGVEPLTNDLNSQYLKTKTSKDEVNSYLEKATADNSLKNIIGFTYDPIVSSDVVGNSLSGLIDGLSTMCIDEDKLKLIIWFDNGWGYASRIIEAVKSSEVQFE